MTCHNSVLATVLVFTKILSYIPFASPQMSKIAYPKTVEVQLEQPERLENVISSLEEALKGNAGQLSGIREGNGV